MMKIPAARSECRIDVHISSAQYRSLLYDLKFTHEELGGIFGFVTVDETLLAKVEAAVALFRADDSNDAYKDKKKTAARVLTTLRKAFSAAYESAPEDALAGSMDGWPSDEDDDEAQS